MAKTFLVTVLGGLLGGLVGWIAFAAHPVNHSTGVMIGLAGGTLIALGAVVMRNWLRS